MLKDDTERPLPNGAAFTRGAVHFHDVVRQGSIRAEIWFEARQSNGGREISGSYRDVVSSPGYRTRDTGLIRFRTTLWAASNGADWTGATADGRRLAAAVFVLSSPEDQPRYAIGVPQLSFPLHCTAADGTPVDTNATVRGLRTDLVAPAGRWTAPTHGGYMFADGLETPGDKPARGSSTTAEGISAQVALTVSRLRWQGGGLVASGKISAGGSGAGYTCTGNSTSFTLRPGSGGA